MCEQKYNGYTNFETWSVGLEIDNDQGAFDHWQEVGLDFIDPDELGDAIKEHYEYLKDELSNYIIVPGVFDTLLGASLEKVNWRELGADALNTVAEGDEPEFDRFDIVEAWYLFLTHYHDGKGEGPTSYGRLSTMGRKFDFHVGAGWDGDDLTDNGKAIYRQLVKKHAGGF